MEPPHATPGTPNQGRDPWPDRVSGHFYLPRLLGSVAVAVPAAAVFLSVMDGTGRLWPVFGSVAVVMLLLAYVQLCFALPPWAGPNHFAPGFVGPLWFAAHGFRRSIAYRDVISIEYLWAFAGPASLKVTLRGGDRVIVDVQGRHDVTEPLIGELIVTRAAKAGALVTRTGTWFHEPHTARRIESDLKSAPFASLLVLGSASIGAFALFAAGQALARGGAPLTVALMAGIGLFLVGIFSWAWPQVNAYRRTGGLAETREGKVYLQLYNARDRERCWVPLKDILILHHGTPGVPSEELEAAERDLPYRLSLRQRQTLLMPQWYFAYFVTREKFHRVHATYVPDPAELRRAWLDAHDAMGDRPATRAGRVRLIDGDLESVGYVAPERVLEIEFRSGALVRFDGVPLVVYEELVRNPLPWQYYREKIHSRYPSRAVE